MPSLNFRSATTCAFVGNKLRNDVGISVQPRTEGNSATGRILGWVRQRQDLIELAHLPIAVVGKALAPGSRFQV